MRFILLLAPLCPWQISGLEQQVNELKAKIDADSTFVNESRRLLKARIDEALTARDALEAMTIDRDHLQALVRQAEDQITQYLERLRELKKTNKTICDQLQTFEVENQELATTNDELSGKLKNLTERLTAFDSAANEVQSLRAKLDAETANGVRNAKT